MNSNLSGAYKFSRLAVGILMLVMATQPLAFAASTLVDNGDGTVTDVVTGLMWKQSLSEESELYAQANGACSGLSFAGYNNWRLPEVKEMYSLIDFKRKDPALDIFAFSDLEPRQAIWVHSTDLASPTVRYFTIGLGIVSDPLQSELLTWRYPYLCVRTI